VAWEGPDDEHMLWVQDRMHFPDPVVPLEATFWDFFFEGANRATDAYELPVRFKNRRINTYFYMAIAPAVPLDRMEAQDRRAEEKLGQAMGQLGERWSKEWLPEIQSHLAWWDAFDLRGAATPDLVAHLNETIGRSHRLGEIHFLVVFPGYMAMSLFDELYRDLFGGDGAFDAYRLLQGFNNKTVEGGHALWDLSRKALASPEVRQILESHAAAQIPAALEKTPAGRAFLADLRAYLEVYGLRGDKWGLSLPCWVEDPAPVIKNLKDHIARPDHDPKAEQARLAAERDRAIAQARERLKGYPQPVIGQFEFLLKAAHQGVVLSEDHGFWIDFASPYRMRRVLMEFGRRLTEAGKIQQPDDVFYLTLDELREPGGDLRSRVAERRSEVERWRAFSPPPVLGTDHGPPPDNAFNRTFLAKFFGGPPQPSEDPGVLKGNAGSPGRVRGPAKVIRSLSEADKLQRGDILVAETTAPPWTPLFATAAAIVTDTGGILSHCAVVAREYRIPAVVGTGRATAVIRDGQTLEVDGDAGLVRIAPA
jgi:pyruvate,water dikinase